MEERIYLRLGKIYSLSRPGSLVILGRLLGGLAIVGAFALLAFHFWQAASAPLVAASGNTAHVYVSPGK